MTDVRNVTIVSDLHLGGDPDFRMMTEPQRLATFIETIASADPTRDKRELVINGDFVDFLAEVHEWDAEGNPRWQPFIAEPERAVERFEKIAGGMDAPVFDALAELLARGHRLTVLPGNHDVELCMPAVRRALLARLGVQPGHDLHVQHDGEGYVIGDALVEHGNRYDESNFIDHERIHNLRVKQSLRQDDPDALPYAPPLGSLFVARVMNGIKRKHAFVDLLKPEGPALVALLLALDPELRDEVKALARMAREHRRERDAATTAWERQTVFRGSASRGGPRQPVLRSPITRGTDEPAGEEDDLATVLGEALGDDILVASPDVTPERTAPGPRLRGAAARGGLGDAWELLNGGGWQVVRLLVGGDRIKEVERVELLRRAVQKMGASPAFDRRTDEPGSPYLAAARTLACSAAHPQGFRYVIFGHTHHAKDIALDDGSRYLNSGTWANLMSFPAELFDPQTDEARARDVLEALLDDLRHARLERRIRFEPTYVELSLGDDGRVADAAVKDA